VIAMEKVETVIRGHRLVFKPWTYGEKQAVLRRIMKRRVNPVTGQTEIDVDPFDLQDEMVIACLVQWDLPEKPSLEALRALEPVLAEEIIAFCQRINSVSEDDRKKS